MQTSTDGAVYDSDAVFTEQIFVATDGMHSAGHWQHTIPAQPFPGLFAKVQLTNPGENKGTHYNVSVVATLIGAD